MWKRSGLCGIGVWCLVFGGAGVGVAWGQYPFLPAVNDTLLCRADFNGNRKIDFPDFILFGRMYGEDAPNRLACGLMRTLFVTRVETMRMVVKDTVRIVVRDTIYVSAPTPPSMPPDTITTPPTPMPPDPLVAPTNFRVVRTLVDSTHFHTNRNGDSIYNFNYYIYLEWDHPASSFDVDYRGVEYESGLPYGGWYSGGFRYQVRGHERRIRYYRQDIAGQSRKFRLEFSVRYWASVIAPVGMRATVDYCYNGMPVDCPN